jgi:hypothetical protein
MHNPRKLFQSLVHFRTAGKNGVKSMDAQQQTVESGAAIIAKAAPPLTVSLATISGVSVNEILLWATLIYTLLMIGHKIYAIYRDITSRSCDR